jgi:cytochrome c biogenesis protein CcmG/thiol:disulfide interchange protein DsbE
VAGTQPPAGPRQTADDGAAATARPGRHLPPLPLLVALLVVLALATATLAWLAQRGGGRPADSVRLETVPTVRTYPPGKQPALEFRLAGLDGGTVDLAAYRGRPLLINFWASWCRPCVKEFPLLRAARERHRADGLEVIGVLATSDTPAKARTFARRNGGTWPVGIDRGSGPVGETTVAYGVAGLPETFFVRRDGSLAVLVLGELTERGMRLHLDSILGP